MTKTNMITKIEVIVMDAQKEEIDNLLLEITEAAEKLDGIVFDASKEATGPEELNELRWADHYFTLLKAEEARNAVLRNALPTNSSNWRVSSNDRPG